MEKEDELRMCNKSNLAAAISALSEELSIYQSDHHHPDNSGDAERPLDIVGLVNSTWHLLRLLKAEKRERSESELRHRRTESDLSLYKSRCDRLSGELRRKDVCLAKVEERERQLTLNKRKLEDWLAKKKEEVKHLSCLLESREQHFQHALRRQEQESALLKERMCHFLKKNDRITSVINTNLPLPAITKSSTASDCGTSRSQKDFFMYVIEKSEMRLHALVEENLSLRETLLLVQQELTSLQRCLKLHVDDPETKDVRSISPALTDSIYSLPFSEVKSDIEGSFQRVFAEVQQLINSGFVREGEANICNGEMKCRSETQQLSNDALCVGELNLKQLNSTDSRENELHTSVFQAPSKGHQQPCDDTSPT